MYIHIIPFNVWKPLYKNDFIYMPFLHLIYTFDEYASVNDSGRQISFENGIFWSCKCSQKGWGGDNIETTLVIMQIKTFDQEKNWHPIQSTLPMITKNFFIDQWIMILSFIIFIKSPFFKIDIYNPDIRFKKSACAWRKLGDKSKAQINLVFILCIYIQTNH